MMQSTASLVKRKLLVVALTLFTCNTFRGGGVSRKIEWSSILSLPGLPFRLADMGGIPPRTALLMDAWFFPFTTSAWYVEQVQKRYRDANRDFFSYPGGGAGALASGPAMLTREILRLSLDGGRGWATVVIAWAVVILLALMRMMRTVLQNNPLHGFSGAFPLIRRRLKLKTFRSAVGGLACITSLRVKGIAAL